MISDQHVSCDEERGTALTHCVSISCSFESFDVEVDGAAKRVCEFIILNYLDKVHTSIIRS